MKHFIKYLIAGVLIVASAFILYEITGIYKISLLDDNVEWSMDIKGVKNAVDFDKSGQVTYVAYKNYIKSFERDGSESLLLKNDEFNIERLLYYKNKLYFLSNDKLYLYDIDRNIEKVICNDIPFKGECLKRQLIVKDNKILLSIGCATNSGIADNNNYENLNEIPYEKSAINIVLNGDNYGEGKTGAYMAYGNSSIKGQKVQAEKFGNSSIVQIDPDNYKVSLYSCGIRSISGWDIDSKKNLICIVEGAKNEGNRPISRDSDYIYIIEKGKWYGWPDYSGGDPIDSPRFKNEKAVYRIINNPPNKSVAAPLYVFTKVQNAEYMAIDSTGSILEKDSLIYYDKSKNMICSLNDKGIKKQLLKLQSKSDIKHILLKNHNAYILDSGIGCIYKMKSYNNKMIFNMPKEILILLTIVLGTVIIVLVCKQYKKKMKK